MLLNVLSPELLLLLLVELSELPEPLEPPEPRSLDTMFDNKLLEVLLLLTSVLLLSVTGLDSKTNQL